MDIALHSITIYIHKRHRRLQDAHTRGEGGASPVPYFQPILDSILVQCVYPKVFIRGLAGTFPAAVAIVVASSS